MKMLPQLLLISMLLLAGCAAERSDDIGDDVEYTSAIGKEECRLCGDMAESGIGGYKGQDNIGLINMNTLDVGCIEINRYGWDGKLIEEATGVFHSGGFTLGETRVHTWTDVDRGYSHVDITPASDGIDTEAMSALLCEDCLDAFTGHVAFDGETAEVAVISFESMEFRPLGPSWPWFGLDNFLVDCTFKDNGVIDLYIVYRPVRYHEQTDERLPAE